jgi:hypothetical protein
MTQTLSKNVIADFETQLAVKLAVGATTGTLVSATDDDGVALPTGTYFLTIDKGSSKKEYIKCTLTGTALTSIESISRQGALTTGCAREHRVGANVIISDFASLSKINDLLTGATDLDAGTPLKYDGTATISNDAHLTTKKYVDDSTVGISGNETIAGIKTFSSSPIVPTPTTDYQASTKKYVDDIAIAGSPDASTTVKGIVEEATSAEIIAGTGTGATGARLFVNPEHVASSGANKIIRTGSNGKIDNSVTESPFYISTTHHNYFQTTGGFYSDVYSIYSNSSTEFKFEYTTSYMQRRDTTSDWASSNAVNSAVVLGSYIYVFIRDSSNNYRLYRYSVTDLASGGTLMTISGQAFATTGGNDVRMTSNGTDFFFNYKGGNSANDYRVSRYTISGTTLTYVSDIVCGSTADSVRAFAVDSSNNVYGFSTSDSFIRKFNSSGTLQYTTGSYRSMQCVANILGNFFAGYRIDPGGGASSSQYERIYLS